MTKIVKGKYYTDENFIVAFAGENIYILAKDGTNWICVSIGDNILGQQLTLNNYKKAEQKADKIGVFVLSDSSWDQE